MHPHRQSKIPTPQPSDLRNTAPVVTLIARRRQSDLMSPDESLSEFEWARVTSKTWDMEQG